MNELFVMIATAGRPDLLQRTLASLAECDRPAAYRGTIVIENGAQRGAEAIVRPFEGPLNAKYLFAARGNKSLALNRGMAEVGDGLIFFTDDDVRFDRRVLDAYARRAEGITGGRFFGGPTEVDYEQPPPGWLIEFLPASTAAWTWTGPHEAVNKAAFLGVNWAAFAGDVRAAGGFDPSRGPGSSTGSTGQETDMQRRLLAAGLSGLYVPEARVWHYIPAQRCTPAWALERNYRHGLEHGRQRAGDRPAVAGLPLWVHRRRVQSVVRQFLASLSRSEVARFKAQHRRRHVEGVIEGIRQQREASCAKVQAAGQPA